LIFRTKFAKFDNKAVPPTDGALAADLPESIKKQIPDEKQCVCGHGFTVEAGFETAKILIEIKDKN
jgi:hypothetical protein